MSNQFNKRNYHHQRNSGSDNNTRKNHHSHSRQPVPLAKLHNEFNPPFRLNNQWTTTKYYQLKIPHTVHFPVFKSSPLLAARATFYQHVLEIMNKPDDICPIHGIIAFSTKKLLTTAHLPTTKRLQHQ